MNRPCRWPGCPAVVAAGRVGHCPAHVAHADRRRADDARLYDRTRDPRHVAFYRSAAWRRARRDVLADQPVCGDCRRRFAHHVDHVVPLEVDWSRRLDGSNLRGLCQPCHNAKTAAERAVDGGLAASVRPTPETARSGPALGNRRG